MNRSEKTPAQDRIDSLRVQPMDGNVRPSRQAIGQKKSQHKIGFVRCEHNLLMGHEITNWEHGRPGWSGSSRRTIFAGHCFVEPKVWIGGYFYTYGNQRRCLVSEKAVAAGKKLFQKQFPMLSGDTQSDMLQSVWEGG